MTDIVAQITKDIENMISTARTVVNADETTLNWLRRKMGDEAFEKAFAVCVLLNGAVAGGRSTNS